jgi:hypothetical protein
MPSLNADTTGPAAKLLGRASASLDAKDWEHAAALAQEALLLEPENSELRLLISQIQYLGLTSQLEALREEYQTCKDDYVAAQTEMGSSQTNSGLVLTKTAKVDCELEDVRDERKQLEREVAELRKMQHSMEYVHRTVPPPSALGPASAVPQDQEDVHGPQPTIPHDSSFLSDESVIFATGHDPMCGVWVGIHGGTDGSLGCPGSTVCGVVGGGTGDNAIILRTLVLCRSGKIDLALDELSMSLSDGSIVPVHRGSAMEGMYSTAVIEKNSQRLFEWPALNAAEHLDAGEWIVVQHAFCLPGVRFEKEALQLAKSISVTYCSSLDSDQLHVVECHFDQASITASYNARVIESDTKAHTSCISVLPSGEVVSGKVRPW